jgi:hypothetical protein
MTSTRRDKSKGATALIAAPRASPERTNASVAPVVSPSKAQAAESLITLAQTPGDDTGLLPPRTHGKDHLLIPFTNTEKLAVVEALITIESQPGRKGHSQNKLNVAAAERLNASGKMASRVVECHED